MRKAIAIAGLLAVLFAGCKNTRETPSGYTFTVIRKGAADAAEGADVMVLNMILKDAKDSVWSDSRKADFPTLVQKQDSVPKGDMVLEVLQMLNKGDSVMFEIQAKELFEKTFQASMPPGIKPDDIFRFEIAVADLLTEAEARKLQNEVMEKLNADAQAKQDAQLAVDTVLIEQHLKEKSIVAQKTASGLRYVIHKQGKGETAKPGQLVKVNYSGFMLDGRCFDSSIEAVARANNVYNQERAPYVPIEVTLGYRQVMPGWEEALMLANKGTRMTVYIPSVLAYGARKRSDIIIENSILKFDMEVVDIK
jgi:FKBP-type peptidyl-prolyl cis-trans isomerase FkpA